MKLFISAGGERAGDVVYSEASAEQVVLHIERAEVLGPPFQIFKVIRRRNPWESESELARLVRCEAVGDRDNF